ncbi:ABC transporter ATP-binding protein [Secundilactobacillus mixtipabuli]|uniref:Glycerol-3-phosphate ABC transporter ATP-binding protein n=1 Tax=Secundilactobacillus mixtipabuli TaxID=1435342 RepID=A0A1Z5IE53_9LACO|nr:ABC transporter ATP-binding protein [Secundilactobacillus mixtipabuli]GAW99928.1 glycerol-3-phosphate ABC transporter ATP-binding protein [Secundilactobacillus mixtipabuli]
MTITLNQLSKTYEESAQPVLKEVSVQINDGEFFVIVGPSGCGKSTLLRMIAGLTSISDGKLTINGKLANQVPPKDRALSMVFQSYALFPFMTVAENVGFGLKSRKLPSSEINHRVDDALAMVNLSDLRDRKPKELSGGQRQRVALARAIASEAKICLMDEPLSNLDAQLRAKMRIELKQLQRNLGLTVIYVTHDQVEAMTMADRVMVLNDQRVQQIDTPINLYQRPNNAFVAQFFGTPQINLLKANVAERELVIDSALHLPMTKTQINNSKVLVGIRPADVRIQIGSRGANARVATVSYLGNQSVITAVLNDSQTIRIVADSQLQIAADDLIKIIGVEDFHIFDINSQKLIGSQKGDVSDARVAATEF